MKKIAVLFFAFSFILGNGLKIDKKVFNAGEVLEGKPIIHEFTLKNTGNREVSIKRVFATCGCTTVNYDKKIPPGGEGKITLKVRTSGYQGKISKRAVVYTDDPVLPQITLTINAFVNPVIKIEPGRFVYIRKKMGKKASSKVYLSSEIYPDFKITGISSFPANFVKTEIKKEEGKWLVELVFPEQGKIGQNRGYIKIFTDIKEKPFIWVNYLCQVEGLLKVVPRTLTFYRRSSGINYRVVTISSEDDKVKVSVKKCPENFKCLLNKVSGGYVLVVAMEKSPASSENQKIQLVSNVKDEEKINVNLIIK